MFIRLNKFLCKNMKDFKVLVFLIKYFYLPSIQRRNLFNIPRIT